MPLSRQGSKHQHNRKLPPGAHGTAEGVEIPLHHLPEQGMGHDAAYEVITSELLLDGSARLNLATFVTTWMPPTRGAR